MQKTKKFTRIWEPLVFRPLLPKDWECIEQTGDANSSSTGFVRWVKKHHNAEAERIWVIFNEFSTNHAELSHAGYSISYKYSVRGGNDIKPNTQLRYFNNLDDAYNYMIFLMESTDRWIYEINSPEYIEAYNKRVSNLLKREETHPND